MKHVRILFPLFILLLAASIAFAQFPAGSMQKHSTVGSPQGTSKPAGTKATEVIPGKMSYQGLLTTPSGSPAADGSYTLLFEILDASAAGNLLWSETQTGVAVSHGTFSVLLGSVAPLPAIFSQPLWLQVTATAGPGISSSVVFAPRTELASAPYSLGPVERDTLGSYWLKNVHFGKTLGYYNGIEVGDPSLGIMYTTSTAQGGFAGFWANKNDTSGNNYLVLQTGGHDRWSLGTMNNDNFSLFSWMLYKDIFYATKDGRVGIDTVNPSAGFDVNTSMHARDTVTIGSLTKPGILNVYTTPNFGPGVQINNYGALGGQVMVYDDSSNWYGFLEPDGNGQGGFLAIRRSNGSTGFAVDGNFGGTQQPSVNITGSYRSAIFNMNSTADNSVRLPDSSISSAEILDEPGVAKASGSYTAVPKAGSLVSVMSASLTVPGPGYVMAIATGFAALSGDTIGNVLVGIEASAATFPTPYYVFGSSNERLSIATNRWSEIHFEKIFPVASAGAYTYYMNAYRGWTGGTGAVYTPYLTLVYFPTAYGSVAASVPASELAGFTSSRLNPSSTSEVAPGVQVPETYTVDLRELELRAAKARADAEKAERELIEARMAEQTKLLPERQQ